MKRLSGALALGMGAAMFLAGPDVQARWKVVPQDAPAAAKADPATLKDGVFSAVIVSLEGTVEVKRPSDADYVEAQKNMELPEGTEIATGYNSKARIAMTGQIVFDVPSLTQVAVSKMLKEKGVLDSTLNIQFGSLELDVQKGTVKTDLKVATANATTSIKGTYVIFYVRRDQMDNPQAGSLHQIVAVPVGVVDHDGSAVGNGESLTSLVNSCPADSVVLILNIESGDASQLFGQTTEENGMTTNTPVVIDFSTGTINTDSGGSGTSTVFVQQQIIQPGSSNTLIDLPSPPSHP